MNSERWKQVDEVLQLALDRAPEERDGLPRRACAGDETLEREVRVRGGRLGEAFAVQHLHGRVSYRQGGWSAAGGRIGLVLVEDTGNVWMISRASSR
jgi:hypothetical protein